MSPTGKSMSLDDHFGAGGAHPGDQAGATFRFPLHAPDFPFVTRRERRRRYNVPARGIAERAHPRQFLKGQVTTHARHQPGIPPRSAA
ncbi:hypothetical protein CT19431_MP30465 [Cupriavidus taiwanensis]|nr:hypothetical protein CT19431_MP30465 [Cupriavidus taiwanensis]